MEDKSWSENFSASLKFVVSFTMAWSLAWSISWNIDICSFNVLSWLSWDLKLNTKIDHRIVFTCLTKICFFILFSKHLPQSFVSMPPPPLWKRPNLIPGQMYNIHVFSYKTYCPQNRICSRGQNEDLVNIWVLHYTSNNSNFTPNYQSRKFMKLLLYLLQLL